MNIPKQASIITSAAREEILTATASVVRDVSKHTVSKHPLDNTVSMAAASYHLAWKIIQTIQQREALTGNRK